MGNPGAHVLRQLCARAPSVDVVNGICDAAAELESTEPDSATSRRFKAACDGLSPVAGLALLDELGSRRMAPLLSLRFLYAWAPENAPAWILKHALADISACEVHWLWSPLIAARSGNELQRLLAVASQAVNEACGSVLKSANSDTVTVDHLRLLGAAIVVAAHLGLQRQSDALPSLLEALSSLSKMPAALGRLMKATGNDADVAELVHAFIWVSILVASYLHLDGEEHADVVGFLCNCLASWRSVLAPTKGAPVDLHAAISIIELSSLDIGKVFAHELHFPSAWLLGESPLLSVGCPALGAALGKSSSFSRKALISALTKDMDASEAALGALSAAISRSTTLLDDSGFDLRAFLETMLHQPPSQRCSAPPQALLDLLEKYARLCTPSGADEADAIALPFLPFEVKQIVEAWKSQDVSAACAAAAVFFAATFLTLPQPFDFNLACLPLNDLWADVEAWSDDNVKDRLQEIWPNCLLLSGSTRPLKGMWWGRETVLTEAADIGRWSQLYGQTTATRPKSLIVLEYIRLNPKRTVAAGSLDCLLVLWRHSLADASSKHGFLADSANALLNFLPVLSWEDLVREPLVLLTLEEELLRIPDVLSVVMEIFGIILDTSVAKYSAMNEGTTSVENTSGIGLLTECLASRSFLSLCSNGCDTIASLVCRWLDERSPLLLKTLLAQGLPLEQLVLVAENALPGTLHIHSTFDSVLPEMLQADDLDAQVVGVTVAAALAKAKFLSNGSPQVLDLTLRAASIVATLACSTEISKLSLAVLVSTTNDLAELIKMQPVSFQQSEGLASCLEVFHQPEHAAIQEAIPCLRSIICR